MLVVCYFATCLSAMGCGSDTGGDKGGGTGSSVAPSSTPTATSSSASPTRAEFISAMDRICADLNKRAKRLNQRGIEAAKSADSREAQLAAIEPFLREGLEGQKVAQRQIERLTPPAGDEKQFETIVDNYRQEDALLSRLLDAVDSRDVDRFTALSGELDRLQERTRGLLQGYGFKECGSGRNEAD